VAESDRHRKRTRARSAEPSACGRARAGRSPHRARLEKDGDLGVLVLDDPPLNLFGRKMVADILASLDHTEGIRALLVRAEGDYFTGGADVNVFDGLSAADAEGFVADLMAITHRIEGLPFPTLASVHGLCLTAGLELSLACDMIWAAESAQFGLVEAVVGLTPLMDAATLDRWNVLNRVLPDAELEAKSLRFAKRLAAGPTMAHLATKRIVRAYLEHGVRGADERTAAIGAPLFETEDLQGAVRSFLTEGPGKARFTGR
jgi:enoyl-CoA hydratase/carnithine racemase